ncbi:hypothetical protein NEOLEDRAFT_349774 [Neolentinus lepideus HHB14362 ss-1]|uniref:Uncharacterized protein n=1 Tax=Neolentinus lepideus HHB14362 ss-1 TaxID=1314782 RepID=A0A165SRJ9_9AGAM|nr:hypothetical protein NEOLEDRAFT_349774 [Neolentinus lepideus HHB14362 ss-1]
MEICRTPVDVFGSQSAINPHNAHDREVFKRCIQQQLAGPPSASTSGKRQFVLRQGLGLTGLKGSYCRLLRVF